jgi:hypothetical protein
MGNYSSDCAGSKIWPAKVRPQRDIVANIGCRGGERLSVYAMRVLYDDIDRKPHETHLPLFKPEINRSA